MNRSSDRSGRGYDALSRRVRILNYLVAAKQRCVKPIRIKCHRMFFFKEVASLSLTPPARRIQFRRQRRALFK